MARSRNARSDNRHTQVRLLLTDNWLADYYALRRPTVVRGQHKRTVCCFPLE